MEVETFFMVKSNDLVMEFIEITSVPFNIPLMHFFGRLRGK
jgi:hypothetical protein